jgi:hypothetical protein
MGRQVVFHPTDTERPMWMRRNASLSSDEAIFFEQAIERRMTIEVQDFWSANRKSKNKRLTTEK